MRIWPLLLLLAVCSPAQARDLGEVAEIGRREVIVWRPPAGGKRPVVIFSHGFGSCPAQTSFLTAALAQAGYLVVAPRHADAGCAPRLAAPVPEAPFRFPEAWNDTSFRGRRDDIVAVLDGMHADADWDGRADWSRLVLMGHSLGGYTVLGMVGGWPGWHIGGVRAVVALSPSCAPFLDAGGRLEAVTVPVLFETGTFDVFIAPVVRRAGGCYDRVQGPASLVVFRAVGHFAWIDGVNPEAEARIVTVTQGFLDAALGGTMQSDVLRRQHGVADLRVK